LHVAYSGATGRCLRYDCRGARINHGTDQCIAFGGLGADRRVTEEVLRRLQPLGIRAALAAIDQQAQLGDERIRQKELALEQARFEAGRARRQYDAVDPDHRLVAGELERRWNEALEHQTETEQELAALRTSQPSRLSEKAQERLVQLGEDLPALWHHPESQPELKKRILRTVVHGIVVRREGDKISMVLHWQGGDHTIIEFTKTRKGEHRWTASENLIALVRELARVQTDQGITATLNRLGKRTAHGHTWTEARVCSFRHDHGIGTYRDRALGKLPLNRRLGKRARR
jgi:hypothetical protein